MVYRFKPQLFRKDDQMPLRQGTQAQWGPMTLSDDRSWNIGQIGSKFDGGGQQTSVHLKMNIGGYVQAANPKDSASDNECYVVADLAAGSMISPGRIGANDDENRGFYNHAVDLQMWFDDLYVVETEAPPPSGASGSGSVSSGSSESVGFFGDQLTASGSWSTSQGGGRTYQDYEITSLTSHKSSQGGSEVMRQYVALQLCNSGPYVTPFSLIGSDKYLAGLPPRAVGNLPLTSAASFKAVAPVKHYPGRATLHMKVTHWLAKVVWWSTVSHLFDSPHFDQQVQMVGSGAIEETVAEYDLTKGPGAYPMQTGVYFALPWSQESTWCFVVDFVNGKVVPA